MPTPVRPADLAQRGHAARADVVLRHGWPREKGHGDPALQRSAGVAEQISPAACHGIAWQRTRSRRQSGSTRASPFTATKARRINTLTSNNCAKGVLNFLCHLHRGAAGPTGGCPSSTSSRMLPAAIICKGFCVGPARHFTKTGASRLTLSISQVNPYALGALIALYERAVGFYGSLVNINAYHQPGVEAGKKAATRLLELQKKVRMSLGASGSQAVSAEALAKEIGADPEDIYHILTHLTANSDKFTRTGDLPATATFSLK